MDLVNMRQAKATMATNLTLPADASNDDEGEAELRAELLRIDETLALVTPPNWQLKSRTWKGSGPKGSHYCSCTGSGA